MERLLACGLALALVLGGAALLHQGDPALPARPDATPSVDDGGAPSSAWKPSLSFFSPAAPREGDEDRDEDDDERDDDHDDEREERDGKKKGKAKGKRGKDRD